MSDVRELVLSAPLWFFDHGVPIFPIKTPGKEPACKSWDDYRCTREQAARFKNYGVRLGRCRDGFFLVVDSDSTETERWVVIHLPFTPFVVTTARGFHRYYRADGPRPKFIHRDRLTIESRNHGQYVVGPGSVHPTGVVYTAWPWSWNWDDIPFFPTDFLFDDGSCGQRTAGVRGEEFIFPDQVTKGERHDQLFRLLRSFKGLGAEKSMARKAVSLANANRCKPPLAEDHVFEKWFERAWHNPDRPLTAAAKIIPDLPLEPGLVIDLDAVDLEGF